MTEAGPLGPPALEAEVMRALASLGSDAAMVFDASRKLVWASPNSAPLLARQLPLGHALAVLLSPGTPLARIVDDPRAAEVIGQALTSGQVTRAEISQDGWRRVLRAVAAPIEAEGNEPVALLILTDITHERRLSRAHQDLIANLSHDLRTPLASLSLLAETLNGEARDDPVASRVFTQRMAAEAERLHGLVSGLLDLARLEAGAEQAQLQLVELLGLASRVTTGLAPQARGRHLTLEVGGEPTWAKADPGRLERALANVVDNAIKFTDTDGKVSVTVGTGSSCPTISVRDTGAGISPQALPHIFDRFYTGDRSRSGPGSGLGLTIARQAVELQGGQINVRSHPGSGTVVEIRLCPPDLGAAPEVV
ncbi:MAG: sensor histidine kinase [Candidatus Dormibacteria bacterium]